MNYKELEQQLKIMLKDEPYGIITVHSFKTKGDFDWTLHQVDINFDYHGDNGKIATIVENNVQFYNGFDNIAVIQVIMQFAKQDYNIKADLPILTKTSDSQFKAITNLLKLDNINANDKKVITEFIKNNKENFQS